MARTRRCDTPRPLILPRHENHATPAHDFSIRCHAHRRPDDDRVAGGGGDSRRPRRARSIRAPSPTNRRSPPPTTRPKPSSWTAWRGCCRACRSFRRRPAPASASRADRTTTSSWSIRSTAPANWWPAATNSRSIWGWCGRASQSLGLSPPPRSGWSGERPPGGGAQRFRLAPGAAADAAAERRGDPDPPDAEASGIVAAVSRSHFDPATDAFLARLSATSQRLASGSAIKLCRVAEGTADVYPRLAPTHQWDVAAGHAVLAAAGGAVTTPDRLPLSYRPDTDGLRVPGFHRLGRPRRPSPPDAERLRFRARACAGRSARPRPRPPPPARCPRKCRFVFRRLEQIEPLADDHPDARIARHRHPAADADRIVAAEPGHIDLRIGGKGARDCRNCEIARPRRRAGARTRPSRGSARPSVK